MKAKVYWYEETREDFDPADSCWYAKIPLGKGPGTYEVGFGSWQDAFCWAYLTVALERLER